jgi:hypothetical protein
MEHTWEKRSANRVLIRKHEEKKAFDHRSVDSRINGSWRNCVCGCVWGGGGGGEKVVGSSGSSLQEAESTCEHSKKVPGSTKKKRADKYVRDVYGGPRWKELVQTQLKNRRSIVYTLPTPCHEGRVCRIRFPMIQSLDITAGRWVCSEGQMPIIESTDKWPNDGV